MPARNRTKFGRYFIVKLGVLFFAAIAFGGAPATDETPAEIREHCKTAFQFEQANYVDACAGLLRAEFESILLQLRTIRGIQQSKFLTNTRIHRSVGDGLDQVDLDEGAQLLHGSVMRQVEAQQDFESERFAHVRAAIQRSRSGITEVEKKLSCVRPSALCERDLLRFARIRDHFAGTLNAHEAQLVQAEQGKLDLQQAHRELQQKFEHKRYEPLRRSLLRIRTPAPCLGCVRG